MSKSEEFLKLFEKWENNHEYNFYNDLKTMSRKTLEDVEELMKKYRQHLFHGDDRFDLMLSELRKLKL